MERMLGVVNLDREIDFLDELTYFRCGASVPYAGRYRLIDFIISNMINSNIIEIAVFVRNKYRSLLDHLGEGKQWNLDKKRGGLFILPPDWHDPSDISKGDYQHFHNNMDFFHRGNPDYVLHTGSQHLCNIDFQKVVSHHKKTNSDVTLIYKNVDTVPDECLECWRLEIDDTGEVVDINNEAKNKNIYMEMFIINKELLIDLVKEGIEHHQEFFFRDAIISNLQDLKVTAYNYEGYHAVINSVKSYYKNSMELLDMDNYKELFLENNRIHTKVKDEVPTQYMEKSNVVNSLVANGCQIEGKVENSVIFRETNIAKGATVKDSIIMARGNIGEDTHLKNIILDKEVEVSSGQELIGPPENPFVVAKRRQI